MKSKKIAGVFVILFALSVKAQTIFYEGFEGPLSNWYNQGTLIGFDNNITPYAGAGMLKFSNNQTAETPTFTLPTGAKYISFYRTSPVQSVFNYQLQVSLLQNGSPAFTIGNFFTATGWNNVTLAIPSNYSGANFSLQFKVPNYSGSPSFNFYVDEIKLSSGTVDIKSNTAATFNYISKKLIDGSTQLQFYNTTSPLNITLIDVCGKLIFKKELDGVSNELNISSEHKGLYYLTLSSKQNQQTIKLVL